MDAELCHCGCNHVVTPGKAFVRGHNSYRPVEERFWAKVDVTPGCWYWNGATANAGYGSFRFKGRNMGAHRAAYELFIGAIPKGLELDHLCREPACVNPAHLEPVTHLVNMLRGDNPIANHARQTHCRNGHEFSPANTMWSSAKGRRCRTCNTAYNARRDRRVKRV